MKSYIDSIHHSKLEVIHSLSRIAGASIQMAAIQIFSCELFPAKPGALYILSSMSEGYQNRSLRKPRCLFSMYYDGDGKMKPFLYSNQGLQNARLRDLPWRKWSLLDYHTEDESGIKKVESEYIIRNSDDAEFNLCGFHVRLRNSKYVWSELEIRNIHLTTKLNSSCEWNNKKMPVYNE